MSWPAAQGWWRLFLAALAALLFGLLVTGTASAAGLPEGETLVESSQGQVAQAESPTTIAYGAAIQTYDSADPLVRGDSEPVAWRRGPAPSAAARADSPDWSASGGVAAKSVPQLVSPPLSIPRAQFGSQWGKHSKDYGLNPGDPAARAGFESKIRDVHLNPDEVRRGAWNPETGGGTGYFFFRQGEDLLVTKPDGQFVTMFPGAFGNSWFQGAQVFP